jgi:hypothetical protein
MDEIPQSRVRWRLVPFRDQAAGFCFIPGRQRRPLARLSREGWRGSPLKRELKGPPGQADSRGRCSRNITLERRFTSMVYKHD